MPAPADRRTIRLGSLMTGCWTAAEVDASAPSWELDPAILSSALALEAASRSRGTAGASDRGVDSVCGYLLAMPCRHPCT